jgi:hypothetical protein
MEKGIGTHLMQSYELQLPPEYVESLKQLYRRNSVIIKLPSSIRTFRYKTPLLPVRVHGRWQFPYDHNTFEAATVVAPFGGRDARVVSGDYNKVVGKDRVYVFSEDNLIDLKQFEHEVMTLLAFANYRTYVLSTHTRQILVTAAAWTDSQMLKDRIAAELAERP